MYFYNNEDKDDNQLFGHSFDDLNSGNINNNNHAFMNFSQSLPSQSFDSNSYQNDASPSPSSVLNNQDGLFSQQMSDYNFYGQDNVLFPDANLDPNLFLGAVLNDEQQAILLSDPNFIRQQQLLQEQQQKANKMMMENESNKDAAPAPHSNLSAMFNTPSTNTMKPQIEPINLITSQQQKKNFVNSQNNRRKSSSTSIPLSSSTPNSSNATEPSSANGGGIDHQRRFNELQARFRVNYSKKPQQKPQQQQQQQQQQQDGLMGTSIPITYSEQRSFLSSSFTDGTGPSRRKLSLDPTLSKSSRISREPSKIKLVGGNTGYNSNGANVAVGGGGGGGGGKPPANSGVAIPINITNSSNSPSMARTMPIQIQRVHRANAFQAFDIEQRQKRLDDQLVKVDFEDITVSELKDMLRQRGKPATGKKATLVQRLQEEREIIQHARANGIPIGNRNLHPSSAASSMMAEGSPILSSPMMEHAASLPDLSSSPTAVGLGSLDRSIADMHIGSPPMTSQQSRRFQPYSSPRPANSSFNNNNSSNLSAELYSSSMPTGSLDMMMMQHHDQQQQMQKQAEPRLMRGFNFKKSYAPFASSTLATPDREDDSDPFDQLEKISETPTNSNSTVGDMEWTDHSIELLLQQGGMDLNGKSADELLSFLAANPEFGNAHDDLYHQEHFQNFGGVGGPDPGNVLFDGYTTTNESSLHQTSSNNNPSY